MRRKAGIMTETVSRIVEGLREAGYNISPLRASPLWQVEGRGPMSTGQLIDLASKIKIAAAKPH